MRFDAKPGGNLDEDQNQTKKRSLSYFDVIFVGILGGGQSTRKRLDFDSFKNFSARSYRNLRPAKGGLGSPDLD